MQAESKHAGGKQEERVQAESIMQQIQTRLGACGPGADLSAFGNARSGPRVEMIKILKNVEISLKILKKTVKNES